MNKKNNNNLGKLICLNILAKKKKKNKEKLGLIYEDTIKNEDVNHKNFSDCVFSYFKKKYIEVVKNNKPGILVSGQIERDLNVGEKKIKETNKINNVDSNFSNFNSKHL